MLKNPACPDMYFSDGEAEAYQRYRFYVIYRLPSLEFLDSTPISDEERKEAKRVGKYMTVATPDGQPVSQTNSPLRSRTTESEPQAARMKPSAFLARGRVRYDGSHSEGNRFIQNDDL